MRLVKHDISLPVSNLDNVVHTQQEQRQRHGLLLPNTVRALVCGPSGCGKTNIVLSLLFEENGLKFENIYVFSKSLFQPKYQMLKEVLALTKGVRYFPYSENDEIIDPSLARSNSVFIFDDVACDEQDKIRSYFSMGRHKNIDAVYLNQTYSKIPKQLVRDNANLIVLFKQDDMNLKHVYNDHVTTDMSFESFKNLCCECWKNTHDVLVIVKDNELNAGRYRKGFDCFIYP